ncbi:MAG: FkbM family methyltransferase [Sulfitobacter dubius]
MVTAKETPPVAAECHGVRVPQSPFLNETRIQRINARRYEGQEIAGALAVIQPGDRVLEMGAGLGLVGAIAAHKGAPEAVLSFEANAALIPHIRALYDLNGLQNKITVRNQLVISGDNRPATLPFHVRNSFLGSSLIDSDNRETTQVEVPTISYAEVCQTFKPDVLLMDIEGAELEFLRHASLDGLRAVVIEFHPDAYGRDGMRECKSILERAGFRKQPDVSTRLVWTCTCNPAERPPAPDGGWSTKITILDNALVQLPERDGLVQPAGVLHSDGRPCPPAALWRNGRALTTPPQMPQGPVTERAGTWLWGGVLWLHFGHFLVESTSRLWALDHLMEEIDGVLFIPKRPRNGGEVSGYQRDFLALLGCDKPLVSLDAPTRVERLIVPGQGFGLGSLITGTEPYRNTIANRFAREIAPEGPEKLYISRSQLPAGRGNLIGEEALETYLTAQGYTIFHPEKHGLREQIAVYKAAKQVIAAEGSALHLLGMVARPAQQVAIVVRRPSSATRGLEQHLQSFAGITTATLCHLTRSWKPLGKAKARLWMGELDMPALQDSLRETGFIDDSGPRWANLDPAEVRARLGDQFKLVPEKT